MDWRAGTGMRLGESWALGRGEDWNSDLDGPGVIGDAGTDGQSSERLSSHGWLLIFSFVMIAAPEARVTAGGSHSNINKAKVTVQNQSTTKTLIENNAHSGRTVGSECGDAVLVWAAFSTGAPCLFALNAQAPPSQV